MVQPLSVCRWNVHYVSVLRWYIPLTYRSSSGTVHFLCLYRLYGLSLVCNEMVWSTLHKYVGGMTTTCLSTGSLVQPASQFINRRCCLPICLTSDGTVHSVCVCRWFALGSETKRPFVEENEGVRKFSRNRMEDRNSVN